MRALLQRVTSARVQVGPETVGQIGAGLLALIGVRRNDQPEQARAIAQKIAGLRLLEGEKSVLEAPAQVLVVSQFTLYAQTSKGRRPSWNEAAPAQVAEPLVELVAQELGNLGVSLARGQFGADMQIHLVADGPVTVLVEIEAEDA